MPVFASAAQAFRAGMYGSNAQAPIAFASSLESDPGFVQRFLRGLSLSPQGSLQDPWTQHGACYTAMRAIATQLSTARLDITIKGEQDSRIERDDRNPRRAGLVQKFERPAPGMTTRDWVQAISMNMMGFGTGHVWKSPERSTFLSRSGEQIPVAYLPLAGSRVKPIVGTLPWMLHRWEYTPPDHVKPIQIQDEDLAFVHFQRRPDDWYQGIGPLGVSRQTAETDYNALQLNSAQLKNGGMPAGLLMNKGDLRNDDVAKYLAIFRRQFTGVKNHQKIGALPGDWDFKQLAISPKDMEWLAGRKWNLEEIARIFGVPLLFMGDVKTTGLGHAGLQILYRVFFEITVEPIGRAIEQALTMQILEELDPDLEFRFRFDLVPGMKEERSALLDQAMKYWTMGMPFDEIARRLGLEGDKFVGSDKGWFGSGSRSVEQAIAEAEAAAGEFAGEVVGVTVDDQPQPTAVDANLVPHVMQLVHEVNSGKITKDQARDNLVAVFGMEPARAELALRNASPPDPNKRPPSRALPPAASEEVIEIELDDDGAQAALEFDGRVVVVTAAAGTPRSERIKKWRAIDRKTNKLRKPMAAALEKFAKDQGDALEEAVRSQLGQAAFAESDTVPGLMIMKAGIERVPRIIEAFDAQAMIDTMLPHVQSGYLFGLDLAKSQLELLSIQDIDVDPEVRAQLVDRYTRARGAILKDIPEVTRAKLSDRIIAAINEGKSVEEVVAEVRQVTAFDVKRARRVARTEIGTARDLADFHFIKESNVAQKEWGSARNEFVRGPDQKINRTKSPNDHTIDSEVVHIDAEFSNTMLHPHDPSKPAAFVVECHCYLSPFAGDAQAAAMVQAAVRSGLQFRGLLEAPLLTFHPDSVRYAEAA